MQNIKKLIILAKQFNVMAQAEKLPEDSNNLKTILKNIDKLETFNAKKKYAEKNLKHLSSGSSRVVYLTPNKTVVKLAKNEKGLAQNKAEASPKYKSKYINKTISSSKDYNWIEVDYLNKITNKEFKELSKIEFNDFCNSLRHELRDKKKPSNFDEVSKSSFYKEIVNLINKNDLAVGDVCRISSWGEKDNRPILIDTGLTSKIFEKYYE